MSAAFCSPVRPALPAQRGHTIYSHPRVAARRVAVEVLVTVKPSQFQGGYVTNHVTKLLPAKSENPQVVEETNRGERI